MADLMWLRRTGLASAVNQARGWVVGICGGYQMLGTRIIDGLESGVEEIDGLGLLPVITRFGHPKLVRQRRGHAGSYPVSGYEIRFGRPEVDGVPWLWLSDAHGDEAEGCRDEETGVWGTSLHGLFDSDPFRGEFLAEAARLHGRDFEPCTVPFDQQLSAQHDRLADWLRDHLDLERVEETAATAITPGSTPGW